MKPKSASEALWQVRAIPAEDEKHRVILKLARALETEAFGGR